VCKRTLSLKVSVRWAMHMILSTDFKLTFCIVIYTGTEPAVLVSLLRAENFACVLDFVLAAMTVLGSYRIPVNRNHPETP
jgi:hypothetical protein